MKAICLTQTNPERQPIWLNPMVIESFTPHKFNRGGKIETGTCITTLGTNDDGAGAFFLVEESPDEVSRMFAYATGDKGPVYVVSGDVPEELIRRIAEGQKKEGES